LVTIKGQNLSIQKFFDGSSKLSLEREREIFYMSIPAPRGPDVIDWRYEGDDELATVLMLAAHLKERQREVILFVPYLPYARMDRTYKPEEVFTLKHLAGIINRAGFDQVVIVDPHSSISTAMLDRCVALSPVQSVYVAMNEIYRETCMPPVLFYPDEGAMKKYSWMFSSHEYGYGQKTRDWDSREITGFVPVIEDGKLKGRTVLIVDDICSKGDTALKTAEALLDRGAKDVRLCVTHLEKGTLDCDIMTDARISRIYSTDSIPKEYNDKVVESELKAPEYYSEVGDSISVFLSESRR
jgi:ribose-phosphate pyrophosphokinase